MATDRWYENEIKEMIKKIAKTTSEKEIERLFDKILTPREINDMARRLKTAQMLEDGESYGVIRQTLGVGNDSIGRVSNKIGYGFRRSAKVKNIGSQKDKDNAIIRKQNRMPRVKYKGFIPGKR